MPQGQFNTGHDVTLSVVTSVGILTLTNLVSFKSKQDETVQKIILINGRTKHLRFIQGWSGSFDLERASSQIDAYFSLLELNQKLGIREPIASITETIQEVSGAISQFRYKGVLLSLTEAGEVAGDKSMKQTIGFVAEERPQIT
jgi:hypothetical protein